MIFLIMFILKNLYFKIVIIYLYIFKKGLLLSSGIRLMCIELIGWW